MIPTGKELQKAHEHGMTLMEGVVLDYVAEGKSARQIADITGLSPSEVSKMAYDLLDREIITDTEQRRKLQVYRLEKIIEALWTRVMKNADRDDVRNLTEVLDKLNTLLALNKEQDAELAMRMHAYQLAGYLEAIKGLIVAFRMIAPDAFETDDQWATFAADQLQSAQERMMLGE